MIEELGVQGKKGTVTVSLTVLPTYTERAPSEGPKRVIVTGGGGDVNLSRLKTVT